MPAAYISAPMNIEIRETPTPNLPNNGILLAVKACGICGSDLRRWREGASMGSENLIAGHEISGIVAAIGSHVGDYQIGEHLAVAPDVHCGKCYYCERGLFNLCDNLRLIGISVGYNGGFAETLILTGEILSNGIVHRAPVGMTYLQSALAEPLSSVLAIHDRVKTTLGETVVVMGAGPIGCLHVAVAKARGARVILSEPNEVRRQMAERFSPELVIDPTAQDVVAEVRRATNGRGAETAICANPVPATQAQAVELVRKRGKVILFGGLPKANPMTTLNGNRLHYDEIYIIGTFSYHPTYHSLALEAIQRKLIDSEQIITHTFALRDVGRAFETAASGSALKVMVTMD